MQNQRESSGIEQATFEEALQRLQAIVQQLEQGDIPLEDALARYEEGVRLLRHCHEILQKAERKIELLSGIDADGRPITSPLDDAAIPLEQKAQQRSRRRSAGKPGPPPDSVQGE